MKGRKRLADYTIRALTREGLLVLAADVGSGAEYTILNDHKRSSMDIRFGEDLPSTKKIFIEDVVETPRKELDGWGRTCKSNVVCYVDGVNGIGYLLHWAKVVKMLKAEGKNSVYYKRIARGQNSFVWGWMLPLEFLREQDYIFKCIILKGDNNGHLLPE